MVNVLVYRDNDSKGTETSFDVAPRIDEKLEWLDPLTGADAVHRVVNVRHERRVAGFLYAIGITQDT